MFYAGNHATDEINKCLELQLQPDEILLGVIGLIVGIISFLMIIRAISLLIRTIMKSKDLFKSGGIVLVVVAAYTISIYLKIE